MLLLGTLAGIAVTGEAADGDAAVQVVAAVRPRVVLMDLNMPRCDGVQATRRIRASYPQTQVVVLTTYSDDDSIIGALQAGALGYLTKDATRAEIGRAVHAAADGMAVLDPGVQQRLLSAAARAAPLPEDAGRLTPRESEVLRLIAAGESNRAIARTCSSARPRSRRTSTGSSPRPGPGTGRRPRATPTVTATPIPRPPPPRGRVRTRSLHPPG